MSARRPTAPQAEKITIDQIRHRAEELKDRAVSDAKESVASVMDADGTRMLLMVAGVVVVAASFAFYLGSRSGRRPVITDR